VRVKITLVCGNHTLRVEITLVRVEITLVSVVIADFFIFCFLGGGDHFEIFHATGKVPGVIVVLKICVRKGNT
jgi:hypothetical protein